MIRDTGPDFDDLAEREDALDEWREDNRIQDLAQEEAAHLLATRWTADKFPRYKGPTQYRRSRTRKQPQGGIQ